MAGEQRWLGRGFRKPHLERFGRSSARDPNGREWCCWAWRTQSNFRHPGRGPTPQAAFADFCERNGGPDAASERSLRAVLRNGE